VVQAKKRGPQASLLTARNSNRAKEQIAKGNGKSVRPLEPKLLIGQAKQNSTTHTKPYAVGRGARGDEAPVRGRAVEVAEFPTAAAENAIATTVNR